MKKRWIALSVLILITLAVSTHIFLSSIYRMPILMYHSIDYTADRKNKIVVSPEAFERQMRYLHDNGYKVVPIEKAVEYIKSGRKPPRKTIAITMDDGYENNYKYAYPILKRYHVPATIFIVTSFIGKKDFLNWDEIKEMSDSGVVDIESHTTSHYWLTGLDDKALKENLEISKATLEKGLGKSVDYICYPMGAYDERVKEAAKSAGYKAGFATKPTGASSNYGVYEIKRVRISPTSDNLFVFAIKLSGYTAFFRIAQSDYKDIPSLLWEKKSL